MLDKATMDAIGVTLRRMYEAKPKGGIPSDHWQPLLALESRTAARHRLGRPDRSAERGDPPRR